MEEFLTKLPPPALVVSKPVSNFFHEYWEKHLSEQEVSFRIPGVKTKRQRKQKKVVQPKDNLLPLLKAKVLERQGMVTNPLIKNLVFLPDSKLILSKQKDTASKPKHTPSKSKSTSKSLSKKRMKSKIWHERQVQLKKRKQMWDEKAADALKRKRH
mmetsp:Transcript_11447/g.13123  ORF Transcript_11447/g.13123 Transcript_11447/m.13123 type:complete len:156 (+) Transcript_11447:602-1069(+)|eukprot:CAMPEP_0184020296 /NCGR_PEP_ID=MMETSP0954-20121128/9269_1 /TAXON_ID=627963 /ORGANISM="Aplanochytrium sp, Strain PBS07" /LENGTH=155 /DNA_ID=CAMNT_0026302139 /DNA_START=633 /DNA_END=1100 /DNA_ORIENTATION=+